MEKRACSLRRSLALVVSAQHRSCYRKNGRTSDFWGGARCFDELCCSNGATQLLLCCVRAREIRLRSDVSGHRGVVKSLAIYSGRSGRLSEERSVG